MSDFEWCETFLAVYSEDCKWYSDPKEVSPTRYSENLQSFGRIQFVEWEVKNKEICGFGIFSDA